MIFFVVENLGVVSFKKVPQKFSISFGPLKKFGPPQLKICSMTPENIHATKISISCNSFEVCISQSEMVLESRPPDNFRKEEWPVFPKEWNQMILVFSLYHFRRPNERQIELGYLPMYHYPEKKIVKNEPQTAKAHFLWIMTYEQTAKQWAGRSLSETAHY